MKTFLGQATVFLTASLATSTGMAQRPLGIDVSSFQGSINWTSAHGDGVEFAFAHATSGAGGHDTYYHTNMLHGKSAGVLMAAYHVADPGLNTPAVEASNFWNFAKSDIKADGKTLSPAITFDDFSGHVGATSYTQWFNKWSSDVIADAAAAGLVLRPVIICSAGSGACDLTTNITLGPFIANYNGENLYTGSPWSCCTSCNPWGGTNWTYWQVSSTGSISGISGNVDLDTFNGSVAELKAMELVTAITE
jgi:lysozyme